VRNIELLLRQTEKAPIPTTMKFYAPLLIYLLFISTIDSTTADGIRGLRKSRLLTGGSGSNDDKFGEASVIEFKSGKGDCFDFKSEEAGEELIGKLV